METLARLPNQMTFADLLPLIRRAILVSAVHAYYITCIVLVMLKPHAFPHLAQAERQYFANIESMVLCMASVAVALFWNKLRIWHVFMHAALGAALWHLYLVESLCPRPYSVVIFIKHH